jgi:succinate-semialdehyde dehydrogenase/glutarate-semialdehyde dehydrogenase
MSKISSVNPATGELLATFPLLTKDQLGKKITKSQHSFETWKTSSFSKRRTLLKKVAALLRKNKEHFATIITQEMGKTIKESLSEVEKCAWVCEYFAEQTEALLKKEIIKTQAKESYVFFPPLGIVFIIMPWNFPFWQVFRAAAPALMAGNTMLLKHASNVPQSAQLIEKIFKDAGYADSSMSGVVIDDPRVRSVSLTGSEQAGSRVASMAGAALKKSVLELGGSDPFIVLSDADVKKAALVATSARLIVSGQSCISAKRFIIQKTVAYAFIAEFKKLFAEKKMGDPLLHTTDVGSLANKQIMDEIDRQVSESVKMGASIIIGGKKIPGKGFYYLPTILTNVTSHMPVYSEETFGPVAAVIIVDDDDEAIRVANDTKFGLGASVWTKDKKRAARFIEELESGSVFVNSMVKSDPRLPFGGIKASGYGRELSSYGLKEFVNIKTVLIED